MNILLGGCHCGSFKVRFSTLRETSDLVPRDCDCDFCRRHGASYLSDPTGRIDLMSDSDITYRFAFAITDFHACGKCGVLVAATWRDRDGSVWGVVNARALDERAGLLAAPAIVSFDHETKEDRIKRRRSHWTPTMMHPIPI